MIDYKQPEQRVVEIGEHIEGVGTVTSIGGWNKVATDSQILRFVSDYIDDNGYSPSLREIAEGVGIKSPGSIKYRVKNLRTEGLLEYEDHMPRTIRPTGKGEQACL